ncbi:MAG: hypothetical protein ACPLRN_03710, partial [Microgenomates group bacterium]
MKILFSQANLLRKDEFLIQSIIYKNSDNKIIVRKEILNSKAQQHLEKLIKTHLLLKKNKIYTPKILNRTKRYIDFSYIDKLNLELLIEDNIFNQNYEEISQTLDLFLDYLNSLPQTKINPYINKNFVEIFDQQRKFNSNNKLNCLKLGILDLN